MGIVASVSQLPAGLDLNGDDSGAGSAAVTPVDGVRRTYKMSSPDDWVRLCRSVPLDVSASRGHDWHRVNGRAGRWVVPDRDCVAQEWDAVHLTARGCLASATRCLPLDEDVATVLAGWNPDTTLWLTDVVRPAHAPVQGWRRDPDDGAWVWRPDAPDDASRGGERPVRRGPVAG